MSTGAIRARAAGFTLMELVVSLVILGIVAALAIPYFSKTDTDVTWFHEQVRAAVRYAQKQAIAQRRTVYVCTSASDIRLGYDAACASLLQRLTGEAALFAVPSGVSLSASASPFSFNPLGQPSAAVSLDVSGRAVSVAAETGYVQ
jgi:MSHA pilin protein MshC